VKQNFYLFVSILLVATVGFIIFQERKKTNLSFPDFGTALPENHQILGIDVSHHQGEINWDLVSKMRIGNDSIQFVYLKLTEGIDFKDKRSKQNQKKLRKMNIPYGVYHFYNPKLNATDQAVFFAKNCSPSDLRPILDIEIKGELKPAALVDSVKVFINTIDSILNIRPIIYTYESFYNDFFSKKTLAKEWFWIANYTGVSNAFKKSNVVAWQFTDKGTVDGISEKVDLNTAKPNFWNVANWSIK